MLTRPARGAFSIDEVYRHLDARVAEQLDHWMRSRLIKAVYGYEDGCELTFRRARERGLARFYDLPIAYWQTAAGLLAEEAERLPAWRATLPGLADSPAKRQRKCDELELADVVFCPSAFVAGSLPEWARRSKKIVVAPFGSPALPASPVPPGTLETSGRTGGMRVLFAGGMTQRKGLADLFAAMKLLRSKNVELVVMGSPIAPMGFYRSEWPHFTHEPPRPHAEVLRLMRSCHVFVLPSIVEGRALVIQEAMSQGLPVIITANTGAEDLIEEGRTGFLVPIRAPQAIMERLAWFAEHPREREAMGMAARRKAARYTWAAYGNRVVDGIESGLGG
jgi:glycosyltransferase involved in cell wall biosynthesis